MSRFFATRKRLTAGLVIAGAAGGAIAGAALTVLGKLVAGAPPATLANYAWNMAAFGLMGAVIGPVVTWSALRNVPLWRTVLEPLVAGVAAAALGVAVGSGTLFLVLIPIGIGASILRLNYSYRDRQPSYRLHDGPSA
jgi:hypothetical protein